MIGDGKAQGMLKYMFNYISKPDFDRRYIEFHARNKANFDRIEKYFKGGANFGVKVLEHPHLFDETDFAFGRTDGAKFYFSSDVISGAGSLLIGAGIPTIYDGESDVCAIFGENARHFSIDGKPRAIIDALAAAICLEKGEDIGITGGELKTAPTDRVCGYGDEYRLPPRSASTKAKIKDSPAATSRPRPPTECAATATNTACRKAPRSITSTLRPATT